MSQGLAPARPHDQFHASVSYAWYVASLLALANVLAFVDRYILSLLIEPVKLSLVLTDLQIGLLLGPAFVIFHVAAGVPMGWLADRKSRRLTVGVGILVWSLTTAACGLAKSFGSLFAARIGMGIGIACLAPCAMSLIGDYFSRARRAKAIGVYQTGTFVGAAAAYLIGGQIIDMINRSPAVRLPFVGELYAWQTAFLVVGLPGLLFAGLMFTVREPPRSTRVGIGGAHDDSAGLAATAAFFVRRRKAYGSLFIGISGQTAIASSSFWSPALFERTWGWDVATSGLAIGGSLLIAGIAGTNFGGWLVARLTRKDVEHAPYLTVFGGCLVVFPAFVLFPLMPTPELAVLGLFIGFFGVAVGAGTSPTAVITITPARWRGRAIAVFYLVFNLFGSLLGPPMVGWVTDLYGDPNALRYGLAITALIFGTIMLAALWWGLKDYRDSAESMTQSGAAG